MDFITEMGYLSWFSIGLIFILAEMFVPGTYLIWFGFSAFVMGVLIFMAMFPAMRKTTKNTTISKNKKVKMTTNFARETFTLLTGNDKIFKIPLF